LPSVIYRSWSAYIDFAAHTGSNSSGGGNGNGNSVGGSGSWVRELEDRQRVALKSAKRAKSITSSRENSDTDGTSEDEDDGSGLRGPPGIPGMSDFLDGRSNEDIEGSGSELDFVSKYEKEINSRDECDGQEEGEGGAIDRALKLLGLDGRRLSSQGSTR
jgi:hypothetical protein